MRSGCLLVAIVLALGGCEPQGGARSAPGPLRVPVTFRASGTEPFWGMKVSGSAVSYSTPEIPEDVARDVVRTGRAGVESVMGRLGEVPFALTVRAERCSDGMSDRAYPFSARLRLGDKDLQGCAAAE